MSLFDRFKRTIKPAPETRVKTVRPKVPTQAALESRELYLGVTEGNARYVRQLLGRGCDPEGEAAIGPERKTPLHIAAELNHLGVTMALLDGGADVDAQDLEGTTPLLLAVRHYPESLAVIEVMDFAGAQPDIADRNGMTALKAAAWTEGFPQELLSQWRACTHESETGPLAMA